MTLGPGQGMDSTVQRSAPCPDTKGPVCFYMPHMMSLIAAPPQLALPHHMTKYTYTFDHFNILMLAICPVF